MPLSDVRTSEITEPRLRRLVDDGVSEGRTIDYKRDAIGGRDQDKKEFLRDVSSFANASGGWLVLGLAEDKGSPTNLVGIPDLDPDREVLRLEEIIRDGIRPRILGIELEPVALGNGNHALVIRIPKSFNPPHQVVYQKEFRFYGRGTNGKFPLDVDQIRDIVAAGPETAERLREFRVARLAAIAAGEIPVRLSDGARVIFHAMPLAAFRAGASCNLAVLNVADSPLSKITIGHGVIRPNVDGLIAVCTEEDGAHAYAQVFRNGIIEVVHIQRYSMSDREDGPGLASKDLDEGMVTLMRDAKTILRAMDAGPPVAVAVSLTGVARWRMFVSRRYLGGDTGLFDRDVVILTEHILESFDGRNDTDALPLITGIWNAAGLQESENFDENGHWRGR